MGFLSKTTEILFRGALASYLLLYALNIKSHPDKWRTTISGNLMNYGQKINYQNDQLSVFVSQWLLVYCQWLVFASLMVVSGMKTGKVLSWMALMVNLILCWNETNILFIGVQLIVAGTIYS